MPGIGERSDAVLRTAMPGHDDLISPHPALARPFTRRDDREKKINHKQRHLGKDDE
jgi:hypothetical protein